jgi:hypothetical protein
MGLTCSWKGILMGTRLRGTILAALSLLLVARTLAAAECAEADAIAEVREGCSGLTTAFNAGKVDEVLSIFLPEGELLDEEGTVHRGHAEIKGLLTAFFERFPGAKLSTEVTSQFRYIAVWARAAGAC